MSRQDAPANSVSWGFIKAEFFIEQGDDSPRPGYGLVSFPAKSIPAVKASYESGLANGGKSVAEPGSAPAFGPGNYCCRLTDPDAARPSIRERGIGGCSKTIQRPAEQPDHLPSCIDPEDRIGIADPLRFGDRWEGWHISRRQAQVHRPAGGRTALAGRPAEATRRATVHPPA